MKKITAEIEQQLTGIDRDRAVNEQYNEAEELQQLHDNIRSAVQRECDAEVFEDWFSIVINGSSHRFVLGGPQISALDSFIESLADENQYSIR